MRNQKVIKKRKTEALVIKQYKVKGKMCLSNKKEDKNNTKNDMDLN